MRSRWMLLTLLFSLVLAPACSTRPEPTSSPTPAAAEPFRITINSWAGFAPLYLAQEQGFFAKNGVPKVEISRIEDAGTRKTSMLAGRIEGYASSVDNFALDSAQGVSGKIVLCFDESYGGDGIVAKNSIKTISDLKGKTVAVQPGLPGQFMLFHVMAESKLKPSDVKIVEMDSDKAGAAFVAGKVDAAVTWEPWLTKAKEAGHVLASTRDYPGLIVDVLVVPDQLLTSRRPEVEGVLRSWFEALEYAKANPKEANPVMAKSIGLPPGDFEAIAQGIRFFDLPRNKEYFGTTQAPGPIFGVFESAGRIWASQGIIQTATPPASCIDPSLVQGL